MFYMLKDKKMDMNELDIVSGGTIIEGYHVGFILKDAGYDVFDKDGKFMDFSKFRSVLKGMGFDKIDDHGGLVKANSYSMGDKTFNNQQLIDYLVKNKGCVDRGAEAYAKEWLEIVTK